MSKTAEVTFDMLRAIQSFARQAHAESKSVKGHNACNEIVGLCDILMAPPPEKEKPRVPPTGQLFGKGKVDVVELTDESPPAA